MKYGNAALMKIGSRLAASSQAETRMSVAISFEVEVIAARRRSEQSSRDRSEQDAGGRELG